MRPEDRPDAPEYKKKQAMINGPCLSERHSAIKPRACVGDSSQYSSHMLASWLPTGLRASQAWSAQAALEI